VHLRVQVVEDYGDEVLVVIRGKDRPGRAPIATTLAASFDQVVGFEPCSQPAAAEPESAA
jgi:hypothetical protein